MEKWSKLQINSDIYIIKFVRQTESESSQSLITLWLSDFKSLWSETIATTESVFARFKKENPFLLSDEIEVQILSIITTIPKQANNCVQLTRSGEDSEDRLYLNIKYYLSDQVPVKFHWSLQKCEPNKFYKLITKALLKQIADLQENTDRLSKIIEKKDREIEQYKLDGAAPLMRKQFVTKPFDVITKKMIGFEMFDCKASAFIVLNNGIGGENSDCDGTSSIKTADDADVTNAAHETTEANTVKIKNGVTQQNKVARRRQIGKEIAGNATFQYDETDDDDEDKSKIAISRLKTNETMAVNLSGSGNGAQTNCDLNVAANGSVVNQTKVKRMRKELNL